MADKKITQFTELTTPANDDLLVIVDVSDTTHGASGTTKKIKRSNLVPKKTSDLTNDGDDGVNPFITSADLPTAVFVQEANGAIHRADVVDTTGGDFSTNLSLYGTRAIGVESHSDSGGEANGQNSHADSLSSANGQNSHADSGGIANGLYSHANSGGVANGLYSSASVLSEANGDFSSSNGILSIANSYSEIAVGICNEIVTPTSATTHVPTDLIFNVGIGTSSINRLTAFSIFKNGMFKFIARALSNITNAVKGSFAVDETGRPNIHNGSQWNALAYLSETGGTIDAVPTDASSNAVSSNGVFDALTNKVDKTNWIDISATSTIVGFSTFTTKQIWYQKINDKLIIVKASLSGTSNSALLNFTIPFTSGNNGTNNVTSSGIVNSNTSQTSPGFATCNPNTSVVNIYRDFNAAPFTASGNKAGQTTIAIEIQ